MGPDKAILMSCMGSRRYRVPDCALWKPRLPARHEVIQLAALPATILSLPSRVVNANLSGPLGLQQKVEKGDQSGKLSIITLKAAEKLNF